MPKLWRTTIEAHRRDVHEAILDAAGTIAHRDGLAAVTMVRIAGEAGVGRATLYKYFSDGPSVLRAWHERSVAANLAALREAASRGSTPHERLERVLSAYAELVHAEHGSVVAASFLEAESSTRGFDAFERLLSTLLKASVKAGEVRSDVPVGELASFCRHALSGAHRVSSAAVRRLVAVTMRALTSQ